MSRAMDPQSEPVFRDEQPQHGQDDGAVVNASQQYSENRDTTPRGVAAREPFQEGAADDAMECQPKRMSITEAVRCIIIHDDKPIENLPTLEAPELKLIGRCVSLCLMQAVDGAVEPIYFTGLVASVTFTAVTLMHVNRYTFTDFKEYIARERRLTKEGAAFSHEQAFTSDAAAANRGGLPSHGYTNGGEVGVGHDGGLASTQDAAALLRLDAAGSLAPAVTVHTEEGLMAREASNNVSQKNKGTAPTEMMSRLARHAPYRSCTESFGPIPYATFLRKNIHDVRFGRDPRSSFYSLFQDPAKELVDMQYLRMFVRRYLVHTSEGNNPREVPLYAFVTVRCACPMLDRQLVYRLAREELPGLMKADLSIEKEKKRLRNRAARREAAVQEYHAPSGLFSRTGILYLTRLPQLTFAAAVAVVFFAVLSGLYFGIGMAVMDESLIYWYEMRLLRFLIPTPIVWLIAGIIMILHSTSVRIPLRTTVSAMIARSIWTLGAVACAIMVIAVLVERLKDSAVYHYVNHPHSDDDLCEFYAKHRCTGYWSPCTNVSTVPMCTSACAVYYGGLYADNCYPYIWNVVQRQLLPLLVFDVIALLILLYSLFLLWKLWTTANYITSRMEYTA